jgi:hypothetical protein
MAPKTKKVVVPVEDVHDELKVEQPKKEKTKKEKKPVEVDQAVEAAEGVEGEIVSDADSGSSGDKKGDKKPRKGSLDKVLALLKNNDVPKAITMVQGLIGDKKEKKPREPSAFNIFISYQMAQLKGDADVSTNEKMRKCSEAWKKDGFDEFAKKKWEELKTANPDQATGERMSEVVAQWKNK